MKTNHIFSLVVIAVLSSLVLQSCQSEANQSIKQVNDTSTTAVESEIVRGKYLVNIMGCNDCHSPKRMGPNGPELIPELMLSGYPADRPVVTFDSKLIKEGFAMFYPDLTAAAGPWGISFAGNLTPHETGLGNWTEEQFKKALTQGKFKGLDNSRTLLPPMPWLNYAEMKDEDIRAVFTYLKSLTPVENRVPAPVGPENM
ncbi:MAG: c-type cytochrome [Roseivirga sp.]